MLIIPYWCMNTAFANPSHALSMVYPPQLKEGFSAFPYVNSNAPKGGTLTLGEFGNFDSLNPFTVKGKVAVGIKEYTFDTLMARSQDEPFTLYPLIAQAVELTPDRKKLTFFLNPKAQFSDGAPLTADDVLFTFNLLKTKGKPGLRSRYSLVLKAEKRDAYTVSFDLKGDDKELPLILAIMPVLPKERIDPETFEKSSAQVLIGSGPYQVEKIDMGRNLELKRRADYWGRDLPVNRGRFNVDRIVYDYYANENARFEAFKAGAFDIFTETNPKRWTEEYHFTEGENASVKRAVFPHKRPSGLFAMVMNMRRSVFQKQEVREAFQVLFPFEEMNQRFYNKVYLRIRSLFDQSTLAGLGQATPAEIALLKPFVELGLLPESVYKGDGFGVKDWPKTEQDGISSARYGARQARLLFEKVGWQVINGEMHDEKGKPVIIQVLCHDSDEERLALGFGDRLQLMGIPLKIRTPDSAQWEGLVKDYVYDMMFYRWYSSLSPGVEQKLYWASESAVRAGSRNYAGLQNNAIDQLIDYVVGASTPEGFTTAVKSLDRALGSTQALIPLYYMAGDWVAWKKELHMPEYIPQYGALSVLDAWWRDSPTAVSSTPSALPASAIDSK